MTVKAAQDFPGDWPRYALYAQCAFMAWTKLIKLVGLFVREPLDIAFLPVSILFGYFHGLIKLYALFTLRMVRFPTTLCHHKLTFWSRLLGVVAQMAIPMTTSV